MSHFYPLSCIDFYKSDHRRQYPAGTELVVSNITPRFNRHANVEDKNKVVWFGASYFVQHFLIETWNKDFFDLPKEKVVGWYKRRMDTSLGKGAIPVDHIEALHDLGYLPIEVKALPEGALVPIGIPCATIHNTHPKFFWLTNYLETVWSTYTWLSCTSATTAYNYRKLFQEYALKTGSSLDFVPFQGHDFSFRGMGSLQDAVMSGAGHLLSFVGTDTVPAIDFLERYYGADADKELIGCSVPATEHSVMCMGGQEDEIETFRRLIEDLYPKGIVSIVSDTWDFWQVLNEYTIKLKDKILARDGKVVFRPDSGDPVKIICGEAIEFNQVPTPKEVVALLDSGYNYYRVRNRFYNVEPYGKRDENWFITEVPAASFLKGAVETLWDIFGGTHTSEGYMLLDSHVGLIYGDSISYTRAKDILERLAAKGFAASNIVFGIGSYTYQYVTRDTWGWAVKATYGIVNGKPRNIFKCPKTDDGGKKSAKGLLVVDSNFELHQESSWEKFNSSENMLQTIFRDGVITKHETLKEIRKRLWK